MALSLYNPINRGYILVTFGQSSDRGQFWLPKMLQWNNSILPRMMSLKTVYGIFLPKIDQSDVREIPRFKENGSAHNNFNLKDISWFSNDFKDILLYI